MTAKRYLLLLLCLGLWACERPARLLPGAPQYLADERAAEVDMLVIRENSEGEYVNQGGRRTGARPMKWLPSWRCLPGAPPSG